MCCYSEKNGEKVGRKGDAELGSMRSGMMNILILIKKEERKSGKYVNERRSNILYQKVYIRPTRERLT